MADENRKSNEVATASPHAGETSSPQTDALDISRRTAMWCLVAIVAASVALLTKQITCFRIASADACVYYIPLAREAAEGNWDRAQLPLIPPLYSALAGEASKIFDSASMPEVTGAQVVNAVCLPLTILCVYLIGATAFNRRVALAAAGLAGLNPWMIKFAASVGPETLYGLMVAAMTLCLVRYWRRPVVMWACFAGILAGLSLLSRAEGLVMIPVAAAIVLVVGLARLTKRKIFALVHVVILLAAAVVVCLPRLAYMHEQTGYYVPDVRLLPYVGSPPIDLNKWPSPILAGAVGVADVEKFDPTGWQAATSPTEAAAVPDPTGEPGLRIRWADIWEAVFMVIGPAAWIFAIVWFAGRWNLPRRGGVQLLVGVVILAQIALIVGLIIVPRGLDKLDRRYVVSIAGLAQLWGGLGLVCLAERMRNLTGFFGRLGRSIPMQLGAMWLVLAGLACWSVFMENAGVRHAELAELGHKIRNCGCLNVKILATSPETACYANASLISMRDIDTKSIRVSPKALAAICRDRQADGVLIRSDDKWCDWLTLLLEMGYVQPKVKTIAAQGKAGKSNQPPMSYVLDARQLADFIDSFSLTSRPTD